MFDFGILGNNARNLQLIKKFNDKKSIRLADNKYKTKTFLGERGIPVPETYALIKSRQDLSKVDFFNLPVSDYIVKPNKGSRGRGIYKVHIPESEQGGQKTDSDFARMGQGNSRQLKVGSQMLSEQEWKTRMVDILEGQHSLGMSYDAAMVEELIIPGDGFEKYCEFGLADIRVIAHNLVPIAAMLRVPTAMSGGTANLDRGGLGVGINIATGVIESMVLHNKIYKKKFPEEFAHFRGQIIPYWDDILLYSSKIQYLTNMGYLALDRVITSDGPKLLEINARAGMKFQLACILPLKARLKKIEGLTIATPEKGVEVCKSLFNPKKGSLIGNKDILYVSQTGELLLERMTGNEEKKRKETDSVNVIIDVDMQTDRNRMSEDLWGSLGEETTSSVRFDHNKQTIKDLKWYKLKTNDRAKVVLGRDAVAKFFIKPIKKIFTKTNIIKPDMIQVDEYDELHILDEKLHKIGRGLNLSRILQPTNLLEQMDIFIDRGGRYNPSFQYNRPTANRLDTIHEQLQLIQDKRFGEKFTFRSGFAQIFKDKLDELFLKHSLITAYKKQDLENIHIYNVKLYGTLDDDLLSQSKKIIFEQRNDDELLGPILTSGEVRARIKKTLRELGIKGVNIEYDAQMSAKMSVKRGASVTIKISQGTQFRDLELESTLDHEIGIHVMRRLAGKASGRHILSSGTAGFIVDEEGLAAWKARIVMPPEYVKMGMWRKYYLLDIAGDRDFKDLAGTIRGLSGASLRKVFMDTMRMKKGLEQTKIISPALYMKDKVYVDGYDKIIKRLGDTTDISSAMVGKVKLSDLKYFNA